MDVKEVFVFLPSIKWFLQNRTLLFHKKKDIKLLISHWFLARGIGSVFLLLENYLCATIEYL